MTVPRPLWISVDVGEERHHAIVIDQTGATIANREAASREAEIRALIADLHEAGGVVTWAVDLTNGLSALLVAILLGHDEPVVYLPGIAANRAAQGYVGAGKSDARDALVIAHQTRMRRSLRRLFRCDDTAVELELLTTRRSELVAEWTRTVNRLRSLLTSQFPSLEAVLDFGTQGTLTLLAGYQSSRRDPRLGPGASGNAGCATARSAMPPRWWQQPAQRPRNRPPRCRATP